ncbi:carbohydrate ABC transporter permease [Paenibacillus sp. FSL H7-0331]
MHTHSGLADRLFEWMIYLVLSLLVIVTLYPLIHVAFASVSNPDQLMAHQGMLLKPFGFHLEAYQIVLKNPNILTGYANTLFIVVVGVMMSLSLTCLGAYVLSRKNVLWNRYFVFFIIFTMFFHGGLIPLYLVVKDMGLINSLWAAIVPFAMNTFHLIIMRTAFAAVPESLEESAKIDGANHFIILLRIVLPLSLPVIAVIVLYAAVERWNGWFYASIFLKDRELFPLQLILREILIANSTDSMSSNAAFGDLFQIGETIKYATIMVATLPILFVYPFMQKYFVKGVMVGALKG